MKERIKKILIVFGIYHPLQSFYRSAISTIQNTLYRSRYAKYKGRGFTCNACGSSYEKFVDDHPQEQNRYAITKYHVIAGYGENIICPNCMSTARERLVLAILREIDLENKKVLHFSPEKPIHAFLKKHALVTTADLLPGFYRPIDGNIRKADATRLDFDDDHFDVVIANHIMEHIPDDKAAIREIYRVLKPGGRAVLQEKLYGQKDHVRIYALPDYVDRLGCAGFEVMKIAYSQLRHFYKYAIQDNECFLKYIKA